MSQGAIDNGLGEPKRAAGPPVVGIDPPAVGQYRCRECGYGITVQGELPSCPMCGDEAWEPTDPRTAAGTDRDLI
jgi:rubrerythrin